MACERQWATNRRKTAANVYKQINVLINENQIEKVRTANDFFASFFVLI
jgi:hypothetical protein